MSTDLTNPITKDTTATQVTAVTIRVGYHVQDADGNVLQQRCLNRDLETQPIPADLLAKIENQCRIDAEANY